MNDEKLALIQISKDLDLDAKETYTEDELICLIEERVKYFLENNKDMLLSYLYVLDISQAKVNAVLRLTNVVPAEKSLALLIYQRQLERIASKKKYKQNPIKDWEF